MVKINKILTTGLIGILLGIGFNGCVSSQEKLKIAKQKKIEKAQYKKKQREIQLKKKKALEEKIKLEKQTRIAKVKYYVDLYESKNILQNKQEIRKYHTDSLNVFKIKKDKFESTKDFNKRKKVKIAKFTGKEFIFRLKSLLPKNNNVMYCNNYDILSYNADTEKLYLNLILYKKNNFLTIPISYTSYKDNSYVARVMKKRFGDDMYIHDFISVKVNLDKNIYKVTNNSDNIRLYKPLIKNRISAKEAKEMFNNIVILFAGKYDVAIQNESQKPTGSKNILINSIKMTNKTIFAYNKKTKKIIKVFMYNDKVLK